MALKNIPPAYICFSSSLPSADNPDAACNRRPCASVRCLQCIASIVKHSVNCAVITHLAKASGVWVNWVYVSIFRDAVD